MKVRSDAKRSAILEVAAAAFMEVGYERTTMAEISARVGGSKATLYGYFPSKEALFRATTESLGQRYLGSAISEMSAGTGDDPLPTLQRFGEQILAFFSSPEAVATHRMVLAESAHSEVGQLFYEAGPKQGIALVAAFLASAMESGRLRRADPACAAQHLFALLQAELQWMAFSPHPPKLGKAQCRAMVERALDVFVGGYGAR